jgi:hypothetical protein
MSPLLRRSMDGVETPPVAMMVRPPRRNEPITVSPDRPSVLAGILTLLPRIPDEQIIDACALSEVRVISGCLSVSSGSSLA